VNDGQAAGSLSVLQRQLRAFAAEREWDQFHTPKNLMMALTGEVGELAELFQWLTAEESSAIMQDPRRAEQVRHELADVFAYVLRLADVLHVDLADVLQEKMVLNAQRYPVERARGNARKYTDLGGSA